MNALITGASKGIGKAIAFQLAAHGYNLAICARNFKEIKGIKDELLHHYPAIQVYTSAVDCEHMDQVEKLADFVNQCFSSLDVLINNVGLFIPINILDEEPDTLTRQIQVNLYVAHYLSTYFGRKMREKRKGHIFNICSRGSIEAISGSGSYCVSKFALLGLTKVLRKELMKYEVKVTAVLPGSTLTSSWAGTKFPKDDFVQPQDIALAVVNALKMSPSANVDEIIITPLRGNM